MKTYKEKKHIDTRQTLFARYLETANLRVFRNRFDSTRFLESISTKPQHTSIQLVSLESSATVSCLCFGVYTFTIDKRMDSYKIQRKKKERYSEKFELYFFISFYFYLRSFLRNLQ